MPSLTQSALRGAALTCAVLTLMLGVEVVGLVSGTGGRILIGLVSFLAVVAAAIRLDLAVAGVVAACAATFTLTWNGWYVGPVRPGDVLIFVAIMCFVAAAPDHAFRTPPWWVKTLVAAILLVVAAQLFFPPDPNYLTLRTVLTAAGVPTVSTTKSLILVNLGVAFKYIVAVAVLPIALTGAVRADARAARWLPVAFATGSALSGWVALSDRLGTSFSKLLTGLPNPGGTRQIGFSDHPNFLAPALVLAYPFAYWMIFDADRRVRWAGLASLPGLIGGVYASGSRGGAVAIVIVVVLSIAVHPRTRIYVGNVLSGILALVGTIFVAFPSVFDAALVATRLNDPFSTRGSDQVRSLVGAQGVRDFLHAPVAGIGLQVSDEAQQVYEQELASGGLILFVAMSVFLLGAIATAIRYYDVERYAGAVLVALIATIALNFAEANLTDRYYYLPAALLIALVHRRAREEDAGGPSETASMTPALVAS